MVSAGGNDKLNVLPPRQRREVGGVLRLARGDLGEAGLERVGLDPGDRTEVGAEDRLLELLRELDDRLLARERPVRIAEVDVAGHGGRLARAADDPGDRLVVLLLVGVGALQVPRDVGLVFAAAIACV